MATVARSSLTPRYGSVAELAAYAGLSPKTIRRLIGAGKIRGLRVGRRVVIPFEDLDRHILRRPTTPEAPAMAIAPNPSRSGTIDAETGRLRPLTNEEQERQLEAMARMFSELAPPDETETDEAWAEVLRGIDEGRPHRPLFEGAY